MNRISSNVLKPVDALAAKASAGSVAVIGGGLAGLVAAITAVKAGANVTVFDGAKTLGGRALTTVHDEFHINMGPHALYKSGAAYRILLELGITPKGAMPALDGATAIFEGKKTKLPFSAKSIIFSRFLGFRDKLEVLGFYSKLAKLDAFDHRHETQRTLVESLCSRPRARHFVHAMCRLSTYMNVPDISSADVAISQLKLGMDGVFYLHKGWISLVNDLAEKARSSGVKIIAGEKVKSVTQGSVGVDILLASGQQASFGAAVLCVGPKVAAKLCGGSFGLQSIAEQAVPVRAACLELALSELPDKDAIFALGMDEASYFSVHSATADLAPAKGGLVQAALYLGARAKPAGDARETLEALVSKMQPVWRDKLVHAIFRPQALVSHMVPRAANGGLTGRPAVKLADSLYIAGDWVGAEGHLSDAAIASAQKAASEAVAVLAH
jgi:phytoene dehydrogenase-like protein